MRAFAQLHCLAFLLICFHVSAQLHHSQSETLLTIQGLLSHYPSHWTAATDFCNSDPSPLSTVVCFQGNVTQLHIAGASDHALSRNFSSQSLFGTLGGLPCLKVLSLVSLGLWGPLPGNIGALSSLEILNLSSNNFRGSIPVDISSLKSLQTLVLDNNMFTGKLPPWIGALTVLSVLSCRDNSFQGRLPHTLSNMRSLRVLALSRNQFYGEIPPLQSLSNLQVLDLEGNFFGPSFPKLSNKLASIVLRSNRFRLNIPENLSSFYQLQRLDISRNAFIGPFNPKLLSLPSVTHLDISHNKFTGLLFQNMSCSSDLVYVNLSSNLLTGDIPQCLRRAANVSYSRNCLSNTNGSEQFPQSFCRRQALAVEIPVRRHSRKQARSRGALAVSLTVIATVAVGLVALGLLLFITERLSLKRKGHEPKTRWIKETFSTVNTAKQLLDAKHIAEMMMLGSRRLQPYRAFSLEELTEAANNFESSALVGEGSHGKVYRGKLADGTLVAVRTLQMRRKRNAQSYTHHLEILSKLRHTHLVSALGHCLECYPDESSISKIHLVFEYVSNGSLRSFISGKKLNWVQRMAAAIGITKGMLFLHSVYAPGIHSNNLRIKDILLDQDFHAKISKYNLPLFDDARNIELGRLTFSKRSDGKQRKNNEDMSDVYSLGTILLEIIVGRPIETQDDVAVSRDILQASLKSDDRARRSIVDPAIHKEPTDESLKTLISICVKCLSPQSSITPSVEDVLWNLQFAAQIEESWKANSPMVF